MSNILTYVLKKSVSAIPILIGISLLAFTLGVISPSDPAQVVLGMDGISTPTEEEIRLKREEMGLNEPLGTQYINWLGKVLSGDLGISYITKKPIVEEMARRIPVTVSISIFALLLVVVIGIPLGFLMALKKDKKVDYVLRFTALFMTAVPGFWLGIVLMWFFSEQLHLLPTSGFGTFKQLIMPSIVLAFGTIGVIMRLNRGSLIEVLGENFILTEKSKGLPFGRIVLRHGLPNAIIPVMTLLGNYLGGILGGSAVVEMIFALPGMGSYVINAIMSRDYPVVQGYVIFTGCIFLIFNLLIDLGYVALNPKIRLGGK